MNCKIIEDLLPLYFDDVCSDETKQMVTEHLQECERCRTLLDNMSLVQITHLDKEEAEKTVIVKKGFQKIYRRWLTSLIAVFMLIPMGFIGILAYGEARNEGISFTNLDDIYRCLTYLHHIETSHYDKAVEMVDFSKNEYQLVDSMAHLTLNEYQNYMKERFVLKLQEYEELGITIENISYDSAYRCDDYWNICISFDEIYPDGSKQKIIAHFNGETMYAGAFSYPGKAKIERDDYIDHILSLYSEDEVSWYQDFEVTFELKEGEKAVIHRDKNASTDIKNIFNVTYGTGTHMIDQPYYQKVFETSIPGKYSVSTYDENNEMVFLTLEEIDIEITRY